MAAKAKPAKPEDVLKKLPAGTDSFFLLNLSTLRTTEALSGLGEDFSGVLTGVIEGESEGLGGLAQFLAPLAAAMDMIAVSSEGDEPTVGVLDGGFQDLQGPLFQAALVAGTEEVESYRGVDIYTAAGGEFGSVFAFPDARTWAVASSPADVKRVVDQMRDKRKGALDSPDIKAVLKKVGKLGYLAFADPNTDEGTGLDSVAGFTWGMANLVKKNATTTTYKVYAQFDSDANAKKAAIDLNDAGRLAELFEFDAVGKPKIKQSKSTVTVEFTAAHSDVARGFAGE